MSRTISPAELTSEQADRFCPNCGAGNLRTSIRCYVCDAELDSYAVTSPPPRGSPLVGDDQITIRGAWRLGVNSLRLVIRYPALLAFPVIGGCTAVLSLVLLGVGLYSLHPDEQTFLLWAVHNPLWPILFAVVAYLAMVIVSVVTLAGMIGATSLSLQGQRPTVRGGFRIARAHLGTLIAWSVLDASVGVILEVVTRRMGLAGAIIRVAGGIAWGLATYFVVQVLVLERPAIRPAIARSARIMRHMFGDVVFSNILAELLAAVGLLVIVGGMLPVLFGLFMVGVSPWAFYLCPVGLVAGGFLVALGSAVSGVVQTALFRYAVTGTLDANLFANVARSGAQ